MKTYKHNYTYEITNKLTGMKYIGVHSDDLPPDEDNYMGTSKYLDAAMIEDGEENFNKVVLGLFETRKEAIQYEIDLHKLYNVKNNDEYYNRANQTSTGFDTSGTTLSDETRKKISEVKKGNNHAKGYKHTEETKRKISESSKGRCLGKKMSEEQKKKLSESMKGKGHPQTDETKKKISEANKGRTVSEEGRNNMRGPKSEEHKKNLSISAKKWKRSPTSEDTKKKISEANKGKKQPTTICPHCGKEGGASPMSRHHFDNCKHKTID